MLRQHAITAESRNPQPPQADRSRAIVLVLCTAAFMAMLDVFVVNVALTAVGHSFHGASLADLSWVLNAYAIVYAALLIPVGRLADRYGRKHAFLAGLAVFTAASIACAAAPGLWWLVAFRMVQAAGAAALTPSSLGLLLTVLPAERRAGAVKIWATSSSFAGALGPVVGGLLVQAAWQWVFLLNVPIGLAALVAAWRLLPDHRDTSTAGPVDLLGAAALAASIGALALGLVKGGDWGWTSASTLGSFGLAVLAGGFLALRTARHPSPVIDPALLRIPSYVWANVTALLFCVAFSALFLGMVLWLQEEDGYSAVRTGLAIFPGPLAVPVFATIAQRLGRRIPAGVLIAGGNLLVAAGALMLAAGVSGGQGHYATQLLPGWIVTGAGIGLALPALMAAATAQLPPLQAATGSAVLNTSRQLGYVLGVALLVAALGTAGGHAAPPHSAFLHGWWLTAAVAALSAATALGITTRRPSADAAH